ncbi:MAG: rhomboid family intramembrane serine protease [Bacteroidetes bacterium]|nr:rhomboid family intramembrane serine protease [Bacteroidota bacterium]
MSIIIVVITCVISITAFSNKKLFDKFIFVPGRILGNKEWYRLVSHGFIHADGMHLFFNMFVLFLFGSKVEEYFNAIFGDKGIYYFILLYLGGLVFASLRTLQKEKDNYMYSSVGASGAVSGVLFTAILFKPLEQLCFYGIICFPGIFWAIGYIGYSVYMSRKGTDNINHDAHLWGAIFGIVFTVILDYRILFLFFDRLTDF